MTLAANPYTPVAGEPAALLRFGARITPGVQIVTVEKVGKRDVVLSNGERINVNTLRKSLGTWSGSLELRAVDDPQVIKAFRVQRVESAVYAASKALAAWKDTPDDDAHARMAISLIERAMSAPAAYPPSEESAK